jgi:hypothetical protein
MNASIQPASGWACPETDTDLQHLFKLCGRGAAMTVFAQLRGKPWAYPVILDCVGGFPTAELRWVQDVETPIFGQSGGIQKKFRNARQLEIFQQIAYAGHIAAVLAEIQAKDFPHYKGFREELAVLPPKKWGFFPENLVWIPAPPGCEVEDWHQDPILSTDISREIAPTLKVKAVIIHRAALKLFKLAMDSKQGINEDGVKLRIMEAFR